MNLAANNVYEIISPHAVATLHMLTVRDIRQNNNQTQVWLKNKKNWLRRLK